MIDLTQKLSARWIDLSGGLELHIKAFSPLIHLQAEQRVAAAMVDISAQHTNIENAAEQQEIVLAACSLAEIFIKMEMLTTDWRGPMQDEQEVPYSFERLKQLINEHPNGGLWLQNFRLQGLASLDLVFDEKKSFAA